VNPLRARDPEIYEAVIGELRRQEESIELVAAENFVSESVLAASGSVMTNKYAEGYPGARYYDGCQFMDVAERLAIKRVKLIFGAEHANVQPHSGTQANMAIYFALLEQGDTILSMDVAHGGHLSHGSPKSSTGRLYHVVSYGVDRTTERIDLEVVAALAREHRPKLILCGASSYPRTIDFEGFARIGAEVGAYTMADIAHIAGLVAVGLHPNPLPAMDVVTLTTHKTMRGPRGGIILCRKKHAAEVDRQVFPGIQGGPLMHTIAGKAVALREALHEEFVGYQKQILCNCQALLKELQGRGYRIITGGSDNHLFLLDLRERGLDGRTASRLLDQAGITANANLIPYDPGTANEPSGVRFGTPAVTTRGMKEPEMAQIGEWIDQVISRPDDGVLRARIREKVRSLCGRFPLYVDLRNQLVN